MALGDWSDKYRLARYCRPIEGIRAKCPRSQSILLPHCTSWLPERIRSKRRVGSRTYCCDISACPAVNGRNTLSRSAKLSTCQSRSNAGRENLVWYSRRSNRRESRTLPADRTRLILMTALQQIIWAKCRKGSKASFWALSRMSVVTSKATISATRQNGRSLRIGHIGSSSRDRD